MAASFFQLSLFIMKYLQNILLHSAKIHSAAHSAKMNEENKKTAPLAFQQEAPLLLYSFRK